MGCGAFKAENSSFLNPATKAFSAILGSVLSERNFSLSFYADSV